MFKSPWPDLSQDQNENGTIVEPIILAKVIKINANLVAFLNF